MSKLTVSAANTVPYARVPLGIQTPLPGSPPPPIASAQVLAQVPTQPAQEYDYDVEYIQVPVQREVQIPVSIPVTKTVPGTAALQATAGPRPVVASWTEAERQEILRRGTEAKAQEDLQRQKIQDASRQEIEETLYETRYETKIETSYVTKAQYKRRPKPQPVLVQVQRPPPPRAVIRQPVYVPTPPPPPPAVVVEEQPSLEPERVFYKPEMRTVVNVEKPAPVVVDVLMKPVPRYEMQEVETMVTEWEEVEVEEESIEYQWTDKLTTMDADKDGKVTIQEQQAWMVQQSPRVQQEMMRAMDSNQDGTVTVAEQQAWLARQAYNQSQKSPVLSQSVYSIQGQQPSQGFTTVTGQQSVSFQSQPLAPAVTSPPTQQNVQRQIARDSPPPKPSGPNSAVMDVKLRPVSNVSGSPVAREFRPSLSGPATDLATDPLAAAGIVFDDSIDYSVGPNLPAY